MNDGLEAQKVLLFQKVYDWVKEQKEDNPDFKLKNLTMPSDLEAEFLRFLEKISLQLMERRDNFYGYFLLQMERKLDFAQRGATGTNFQKGKFVLHVNPIEFLKLEIEQMFTSLEHEVLHIVSLHWQRAKELRERYDKVAINMAMDVVVNTYLKFLPPDAIDIFWVNKQYDLLLKPYETLEYYVEEIQKALEIKAKDPRISTEKLEEGDIPTGITPENTHDLWDENDDLDMELLDNFIEGAVDKATKGELKGHLAVAVGRLKELNHELPWNWYLRRLVGSVTAQYKHTTTRRNRRQQERLELSGRLKKHMPRIAVALDTSGSISDGEFHQAMKEVFALVRLYKQDITIIECDNTIRRVYKVRTLHDVKERLPERGGTSYAPVIEYCNKEHFDLLVYFTDGKGEEILTEKNKGYKILWVLSGDGTTLSLGNSYGLVKKLKPIKQDVSNILDYYDVEHDGFSMNAQERIALD